MVSARLRLDPLGYLGTIPRPAIRSHALVEQLGQFLLLVFIKHRSRARMKTATIPQAFRAFAIVAMDELAPPVLLVAGSIANCRG